MNKQDFEKILITECPNLFQAIPPPEIDPWSIAKHPMPITCFGVECGPGWWDIILEASRKIEEVNKRYISEGQEAPFVANQIKEKFGGLRYYLSCSTDEVEEIISEAESKCSVTCEMCGSPGTTRGDSWVYTECDDCFSKRN